MLRGRTVQNEMYEGTEKRRELINELRGTHALQAAGLEAVAAQQRATEELQKRHELFVEKVCSLLYCILLWILP